MATVTIELPTLLHRFADDQPQVTVEADTLRQAIAQLSAQYPAMNVHLFDETGAMRQHVLCFHNGTNSRWSNAHNPTLRHGDTLTIMQAVSGG